MRFWAENQVKYGFYIPPTVDNNTNEDENYSTKEPTQ